MKKASRDDLKDIIDFLAEVIPFSSLADDLLLELARQLDIEYLPKHTDKPINVQDSIYLIRTGAFEITGRDGQLVDRLSEGECFGVSTVLEANPESLTVQAIEDSLVYRLPKNDFISLLKQNDQLRSFFDKLVQYRSRSLLVDNVDHSVNLQWSQSVETLIQNKLVYCSVQNSIREAAEIMRENKVSCLLLTEDSQLFGIVTDRDLRNRVVADGIDVDLPITRISTREPVTLSVESSIMEAQVLMSQVGVHHLPIMEDNIPIGVITASDIVRSHSVSIVHFVDRLFRVQSIEAITTLVGEVPSLFDHWIQADVSAVEIGESFAIIGDAFVRKSIALALRELGEPPMLFAWLTFGSQARKDQSFGSDQDNGLILEREPDDTERRYFNTLTLRVCELLDLFGYPYCPGNIMASNPKWQNTVPQWQSLFYEWVDRPDPESLLNASIFFDLRIAYGPDVWLDQIVEPLGERLSHSDLFFMHMTKNALRAKPPLGFFRSFMVNSSGDHENELDVKHHGVALINDLARIIALSEGKMAANTIARLKQTSDVLLQAPLKESLIEAWLLLNELKLESQMTQKKQAQLISNYINPDHLSPLRRAHLKNAFKAIERAQKAVGQHFLRHGGV